MEVQGYRTVCFLSPFFGAKTWCGLLRVLDLNLLFFSAGFWAACQFAVCLCSIVSSGAWQFASAG